MTRIIFIAFFLNSCSKDYNALIIRTWLPIQVEEYSGQINDSHLMHYAFTFTDSGHLFSRALGTNYDMISKFELNGKALELSGEDGSNIFEIISLSRKKLKIRYDSFNIVTYIPFPEQDSEDQTKIIFGKLSNESWYFDDSFFNNKVLIEFKDSLEDKIVRHYLRDQLNAAGIHVFENGYSDFHMDAIWGVNYFNHSNILGIVDLYGNNFFTFIFITEILETHIEGFQYINQKKKPVRLAKAQGNTKELRGLLSKEWELSEFEEVKDENSTFWSAFNDIEKSLKLSDFKERCITFNLQENHLFTIKLENDTLTQGTWRLSSSGQMIELTSRYYDDGDILTRNHFLSIVELDSTHLKIFRRENIKSGDDEFAKLKFLQTYKAIGNNHKESPKP